MHRLIQQLILGLLLCISASAWGQQLVEGRDYIVLRPALPTNSPDAIVVTEFFSYQCPHCFAFSGPFNNWASKQPSDVVCRREAVSIGHAAWEASAKTFYTLAALGKLESLDADIFQAIHREATPFASESAITEWLSGKGVAPETFKAKYRAFDVDRSFRQAQQLAIAHKLPSVPAIAIDGKYLVAIASNIDFAKQLSNVNLLIARARAERRAAR
jgi:protein dithiol oxidoreductase (disulfide-forming)